MDADTKRAIEERMRKTGAMEIRIAAVQELIGLLTTSNGRAISLVDHASGKGMCLTHYPEELLAGLRLRLKELEAEYAAL